MSHCDLRYSERIANSACSEFFGHLSDLRILVFSVTFSSKIKRISWWCLWQYYYSTLFQVCPTTGNIFFLSNELLNIHVNISTIIGKSIPIEKGLPTITGDNLNICLYLNGLEWIVKENFASITAFIRN